MKVRMLYRVSGMRNGVPYPPVGEVIELKEGDQAQDLILNEYAEVVEEPKIETAEVAAPEMAARAYKPRPRK